MNVLCVKLCLAVAGTVSAVAANAALEVEYGGGSYLRMPGVVGHPAVQCQDWCGTAVPDIDSRLSLPDERTGVVRWHGEEADKVSVDGLTEARMLDGKLSVQARFVSRREHRPECVDFTFEIDPESVQDCTWRIDAPKGRRTGRFADKKHDGQVGMYGGPMSAFAIVGADGRTRVGWTFPAPQPVTFQDSRKWQGGFTLRIGSRPKTFAPGTEIAIPFTLSSDGGIALKTAKPCVVAAGEDWIPLDYRKNIAAGSALDFSGMGLQDAPAGKYGWLKNVGGHFVFADRPDRRLKLYGVNLCFTANYPDHALADELVERLVRLGYNTVRLHHYEREYPKGDNAERLDYLIAKGIEKGLYFTTDVYVSRRVSWKDIGLPERGNGEVPMQTFKILAAIWEPAFEDWKRFADKLLKHVNPHTGRCLADEPGMPLISLVNEGQLTMGWNRGAREDPIVAGAYAGWLAAKRAADPSFCPDAPASTAELSYWGDHGAAMALFMTDIERRSASRMRDYLRSIGVKALLTNANCGPHPTTMIGVRKDVYDYVDDHFYVDHPSFLKKPWSLPSRCGNANPVLSSGLPLMDGAFTRVAGMPLCITEWNFSGPGMYRGVGGIMTGAFGALQDYDGLWRFAYTHSVENLQGNVSGMPGYFDVATDALGQMGDRASVCLFLRGDLDPAARACVFAAGDDVTMRQGGQACGVSPRNWKNSAWQARMATMLKGMSAPAGSEVYDMGPAYAAPKAPFSETPNPAFRLDRRRGAFVIDTPRTAGGFVPEGTLDCGRLAFTAKDAPATVWASTVDRDAQDIATANRLVVFHLTDVQADGNRYLDETKQVLLKWGKSPSVVRRGSARISVRLSDPAAFEVWSLRTDGTRLERMPASVESGRLVFEASVKGPEGARLVYEVVRGNRVTP